jgi:serine/threonine protein kinase
VPDRGDPDTQPIPTQQPGSAGWTLGGRYRVVDRLGQGGMAEVFRAHDELLDRDVAVKVFRTLRVAGEDTHTEERRELELQSLAQLSHPNLITLFDGSVADDGPGYLVLELVDGPDLASRLRDGPLPEPEARLIGAQLADALSYVHAHGMVHRDVKPANILLGADDVTPESVRARLSDFGIVRMVGSERMTAADLTLGTASYVAPEQARGADVEPPADVYALGLVLIEALSGVRCFDGPLHEALAARLTTAPTIPAGLPAPWPELLAAMTARDPAQRPSAADVADGLRSALPTGAFVPVPDEMATAAIAAVPAEDVSAMAPVAASVAPRRDGRRRSGATLVMAAAVFAALLAAAGFTLFGGSTESPGAGSSTSPSQQRTAPTAPRHSTSQAVDAQSTSSTSQPTSTPSSSVAVRSSTSSQPQSTSATNATTSVTRTASTSASSTTSTSTAPATTTTTTTAAAAASSTGSTGSAVPADQ